LANVPMISMENATPNTILKTTNTNSATNIRARLMSGYDKDIIWYRVR
jgi:type 1 fimbria pilin